MTSKPPLGWVVVVMLLLVVVVLGTNHVSKSLNIVRESDERSVLVVRTLRVWGMVVGAAAHATRYEPL